MDHLIVLMKENLCIPRLDCEFEKKLSLNLLLLMVLMKELGWVLQMSPLIVLMKETCQFIALIMN